ncbi:unnamed protein product [Bemisia tabaci]|uniref:Enoyl-CoA delta isomerase 2, mitochondrial n=1 Tax=Bemisia tabaci TaxID=7038 RepID=A0A9P0F1V9_BEMTA|nr:PREDICTED: enoyl-CoA delta isomerase 2, mitochondrial [Bemisia tabaci]CAH0388372.1 unnamed protein product [Bemisia tabaci]
MFLAGLKFCGSIPKRTISNSLTVFRKISMAEESPLLVSTIDKIRVITLNRPKKNNAISQQMYLDITKTLNEAASDAGIMMCVVTSNGRFFSSGTDLQNSLDGDLETIIKVANQTLLEFVNAFILFPKLLVAIVNGPAMGISCTILGLFDIVYASEKATFNTPFSKLGLTAEGCSSYTFPRIMGYTKAAEMLYLNRVLTAPEAKSCGLVADVYKEDELDSIIWPRLRQVSSDFNEKSIIYSKQLVRRWDKEDLLAANKAEVERLGERWASEDVMEALIKFMNRKHRSKM